MGKILCPLSDEDFDNGDGGAPLPYLPAGLYPAQLIKPEYMPSGRWGEKAVFWWRTFHSLAMRPEESTTLPRYYNITRDERGKLEFGHRHEYRKDWIAANAGRHPSSWNRLPPSIFSKGLYIIDVTVVTKDSKGDLPKALYYSRVDRIVRPVRDGERFDIIPLHHLEKTG